LLRGFLFHWRQFLWFLAISQADRQHTTCQRERDISRRTSHEQQVVRRQSTVYWARRWHGRRRAVEQLQYADRALARLRAQLVQMVGPDGDEPEPRSTALAVRSSRAALTTFTGCDVSSR
jgi:hypothetical protein